MKLWNGTTGMLGVKTISMAILTFIPPQYFMLYWYKVIYALTGDYQNYFYFINTINTVINNKYLYSEKAANHINQALDHIDQIVDGIPRIVMLCGLFMGIHNVAELKI